MKPGTPRPAAQGDPNMGPVSKRRLTTREKILLLEGSKLNGSTYPPWVPPNSSDFDLPQFTDAGDLSLSKMQLDVLDEWRRPTDTTQAPPDHKSRLPTMLASKAIDLIQDVTTDCSVVASLCAATARSTANHRDVIVCNIYPRDTGLQQPTISPNGKYVIRLFFNGCPRKVVIDDRLPASRTTRSLHVIDRNNPGLLWPALVEKAYLKVRGGYDFPGSNSGTDLWVLTGWIPEQLFIQSDDIVQSALWRRVFAAFKYGDVLITVGTGKLTENEENGMGLAGEHDYAILDMKECEGQQFFLVKNPWAEGIIWKGHASFDDNVGEVCEALGGLGIVGDASLDEAKRRSLAPGTFWMRLNDVFQSFESIYLNWNPQLFSHKNDVHFKWDLSTCSSPEGFFGSNPQYLVRSEVGGTVWLLLNRHFTSRGQERGKKQEPSMTEAFEPGFISLCAFDNWGERVVSSDGATIYGPYVDSPNTLLKLELPSAKSFTIVVSEQALQRYRVAFTLSAFSLASLCLSEAHDEFTHSASQRGRWTASTAGGNASGLSYHRNPQFSIRVAEAADLFLLLDSPTQDLPIHVKLVWAKGGQVQIVTSRDVVGDSGEYRKGFAFAKIPHVEAGVYTVVCSTFEQGQLGDFTLQVKSTAPCILEKISVASAGRFVSTAPLAVFSPGNPRLLAPLISQRLNRVSIVARSCEDRLRSDRNKYSPLKLSIECGQGPSKRTLRTSGGDEYSDGRAGVHCHEVDIQPSMCETTGVWIVIERLASSGMQGDEFIQLDVLSDAPVEIHSWGVGEG